MSAPRKRRRANPLLALPFVLAMLAGLGFVVRGPARVLRREVLVETARQELEGGLARYHVEQGKYLPEPFLSGGELARILLDAGCLEELPLNPVTGQPFGTVDLEEDPFFYSTSEDAASYVLETLLPDR